ncbi:MBL fold metallo-hydrolase [Spirochaeta thermophila]|uniref:Predicted beta lactamase like protein n=1 Tax=Winmispira thermophila (strain ATCC 49972 / DSM 6192 / RI 19.B1) TaxID=665571 RepID=E0RNQ2_WINT6|nr:MBL fold metallo-hydrolase [Spirochaeta thermophila]ADN02643.1 predicted beta lactamase like protein [Spirochaeta thermophila DSM 6192]
MKVFAHFSLPGFSNTYLVGPEEGGDAILVDPGCFDEYLLNLVEDHGYYVRHVLVTHGHRNHFQGIKTILRIYDATVYANTPHLDGVLCEMVHEGRRLDLGWVEVRVLSLPGHSRDSVAYVVGPYVFTGDALTSGKVGSPVNPQGKALLIAYLNQKLLALPGHYIIFPGHGPPTTVRTEAAFNVDLRLTPGRGPGVSV